MSSSEMARAGHGSLEQDLQDLSFRYRQQCSEVSPTDESHSALAKLYAAAGRLHQALREGAVAEAILEIGSNLMGCEQMALLLVRGPRRTVSLIGSVGLTREQLQAMQMNAKEIIEQAPADGVYIKGDAKEPDLFFSPLGVTACAPFLLERMTKGAIVLFDLLQQHNGLDSGDRELLKLLSAYAGPCLSTGKVKDKEMFE